MKKETEEKFDYTKTALYKQGDKLAKLGYMLKDEGTRMEELIEAADECGLKLEFRLS